VRASLVLEPPPALCIDIGGGSVEVMIGDGAGLRWAASLPLGVGRLTAELTPHDPPTKADRIAIEDRVREVFAPYLDDVRSRTPHMAVGTSGTINDLARLAAPTTTVRSRRARTGCGSRSSGSGSCKRRIMRMSTAERRRLPGIEDKRAELLPAGVTLLVTMLDELGLDEFGVDENDVQPIGRCERASCSMP